MTRQTRPSPREDVTPAASLQPLFCPRAVAVIGASRDPASVGGRLIEALRKAGFHGGVYPVNPHAASIQGLPAYASIGQVPRPVDLALIAVPSEHVPDLVPECAAAGIRALVVISAGFAEVDEAGRHLQARLLAQVRDAGMRMVGPNCFGVVNTDPAVKLNATFSSTFPPAGRIAMSSQSGALGLAILRGAGRLNLGISTFVSVGNKADISGNDLLEYWEQDPRTDVILLYLESFGNPRRFARIARRVSAAKPIVAVKAGRSQAGRRAAGSHTAALAASDVAVDALFHQAGVIRAETLDDMFSLATFFAHQSWPQGRRVAIVTNAGGPGILCADACDAAGLEVPEFSASLTARLHHVLPPAAAVKNPIDLIASATAAHYRETITAVMTGREVDALIVLYISVNPTDTSAVANGILDGVRASRAAGCTMPVLIGWMAEGDLGRTFAVGGETIPAYAMPETPARVAGKAAAYGAWRRRPPEIMPSFEDVDLEAARRICTQALRTGGAGWLSAKDTHEILGAIRVPTAAGRLARTAAEAVAAARDLGFPVALKLVSRIVIHKTDVGGVALNLGDDVQVRAAYEAIVSRTIRAHGAAAVEGVLVQVMVPGGVEVMVGMTQDPQFGPLVAFGLGGIHVELLRDVAFRITPLSRQDARDMIREIRGYRLLEGYRGHPAADLKALEDVVLRLSTLVEAVHDITELDLNPIFARPPGAGCVVADARIRVGPS